MNPFFYELPLVFTSGILGSAHCLGMCGPISAAMNLGTDNVRGALTRQTLWSGGRVFTYAFLGMVAGFAGAELSQAAFVTTQAEAVRVQAAFAVVAGLLLIVQGAASAGWFRFRQRGGGGGCPAADIFGRFLSGGSSVGVFVAGIATGFLPCGLVYSFVALAAASASVWKGPLLMTAFGLGTIPMMLVTGAGLTMTSLIIRRRLMKVAAICVLITGLLTVGRGLAFASQPSAVTPADSCPLCVDEE